MRSGFVPLALAGLLTGLGCRTAHQMYPGPKRPDNEVAIIATDGTNLAEVDGDPEFVGNTVAVLPGRKRLSLRLDDAQAPSDVATAAYSHRTSRSEVSLCFVAKAGHRYVARPNYDDQAWRAEIVDQTIAELVTSEDCGGTSAGYSESVRLPIAPLISVPTRTTEK